MPSFADLMRLDGRRALVAGGAGNIGRVAVETLQELGADVAVLDREEALERAAPDAVAISCDLADESSARAAARAARARLGGIDIVVHAAALVGTSDLAGWATTFEEQTVAAWDAALRVNVTSAFVLVQELRGALVASGCGSVVLVGSIYGSVGPDPGLYEDTPLANPTAYGVSKGGLAQLGRYLATQLAPRARVNLLSPGGIERGQPELFRERYASRTPLRRMATEQDLRGAIGFLASDLSAYVTGQELLVDGGWTAW